MKTLTSSPGALRILVISIVARLPLAMLAISLLVHAVHLTGSYATAGIVSGVNAVALGIGGPLLGKLVDRRGQTGVLVLSGCLGRRAALCIAALPVGAPAAARRARGGHRAGDAAARSMRALAPALARARRLGGAGGLRRGDLCRRADVGRRPAARARHGCAASTGFALAVAGVSSRAGRRSSRREPALALVAARACRPPRRRRRSAGAGDADARARSSSPSACSSAASRWVPPQRLRRSGAARPQARCSASGASAPSPAASSRRGSEAVRAAPPASRSCSRDLPPAHVASVAATGSLVALGAVLLVAGAALAPAFASVYAMVERVAPAGAVTEAFAWLEHGDGDGRGGGLGRWPARWPTAPGLPPPSRSRAPPECSRRSPPSLRAHTLAGPVSPLRLERPPPERGRFTGSGGR